MKTVLAMIALLAAASEASLISRVMSHTPNVRLYDDDHRQGFVCICLGSCHSFRYCLAEKTKKNDTEKKITEISP